MDRNRTDFPYTTEATPDYALINVTIPKGRTLKVEASAMAYMDSSIIMKTKMGGGLKRMLSGEKLFINEFSAPEGDADIGLAPGCPGDIGHVYLENETIYLQNSAFVALSPDLKTTIQFQGFKGFFSGEKLFLIEVRGTGDLWFNTYGALLEIDVVDSYVVDTGYIVAFTEGLTYSVRPVAGLKSLFFSGEGLVCRFSGEGTVWIQTRLAPAFARWADPFRKQQKNK